MKQFLVVLLLFSVQAVAQPADPVIKMGVISLAPPSKIYKQWQPFVDYLSNKINRNIELVVPRGFKKIKQAVETKQIDLFFVNSYIFYRLKQSKQAVAIAQMQNINGGIISNSVFFVRSDSGVDKVSDLKGEKMAYVSPMGAGGYLAPRATLYKRGVKLEQGDEENFTKNLTSSLHKVLLGDVKAGTMCGINYKLMSKRINTGDLKIIGVSDDYPEAVIAARSNINNELRKKITREIINMNDDKEGKRILSAMAGMKIKKFVKYNPKMEKLTENLLKSSEFDNKK